MVARRGGRESEKGISAGAWSVSTGAGCIDRRESSRERSRIVGAALSPTPILNWLLFGYGVPAASFAYAGRLLRRQADDIPARTADALAMLFAAFWCTSKSAMR